MHVPSSRLSWWLACAEHMSLDKPTALSGLPARIRRDIPQQMGQCWYCCGYLGLLDPCLPSRAHIPHQVPSREDATSQILSSPISMSLLPSLFDPLLKAVLVAQPLLIAAARIYFQQLQLLVEICQSPSQHVSPIQPEFLLCTHGLRNHERTGHLASEAPQPAASLLSSIGVLRLLEVACAHSCQTEYMASLG